MVQESGDLRVHEHEWIAVPHLFPPGQDREQAAEIDTEEHQDEERRALQPDGSWRGCRTLRRGGAGSELWLVRHLLKTVAEAI